MKILQKKEIKKLMKILQKYNKNIYLNTYYLKIYIFKKN